MKVALLDAKGSPRVDWSIWGAEAQRLLGDLAENLIWEAQQ
jgi:hypothetical protein